MASLLDAPDDSAAISALRVLKAALAGGELPDIPAQDAQGAVHAMCIMATGLLTAAFRALGTPEGVLRRDLMRYLDNYHAALILGEIRPIPDVRVRVEPREAGGQGAPGSGLSG